MQQSGRTLLLVPTSFSANDTVPAGAHSDVDSSFIPGRGFVTTSLRVHKASATVTCKWPLASVSSIRTDASSRSNSTEQTTCREHCDSFAHLGVGSCSGPYIIGATLVFHQRGRLVSTFQPGLLLHLQGALGRRVAPLHLGVHIVQRNGMECTTHKW